MFISNLINFYVLIFYAAHLEARAIEIQHRGTNKLIVNPLEELRGEIRSAGDGFL